MRLQQVPLNPLSGAPAGRIECRRAMSFEAYFAKPPLALVIHRLHGHKATPTQGGCSG